MPVKAGNAVIGVGYIYQCLWVEGLGVVGWGKDAEGDSLI